MLPLEPLASLSPIERLILRARAPEAAAELARLSELSAAPAGQSAPVTFAPSMPSSREGVVTLTAVERAAVLFARGALALREGSLAPAQADLEAAAAAFVEAGEPEAGELSRAEALLAKMRRGPRQAFAEAEAALSDLAGSASTPRVRVVAIHYRGAAARLLGDAQKTQRCLLDALAMAEAHPPERPKILNSLGTLYVVMGAYGAAEALLEHAAELHHLRGDTVGEAIACGQLGAAALGLGDLAKARTWLQRQEWLASQVGDAFGRARALTFLADVALDLGRPDDALELSNLAREVARSTTPPLAIWLAYATRAAGRARADLGDPGAEAELRDARARFTQIGNVLGLALTEWDLVRLGPAGATMADGGAGALDAASAAGGPAARNAIRAVEAKDAGGAGKRNTTSAVGGAVARNAASAIDAAQALTWEGPAWALASLGLSARVAGLLRDHALQASAASLSPEGGPGASGGEIDGAKPPASAAAGVPLPGAEEAFFAVAQAAPHLGVPREIELVYEAPGVLGDVSIRRTSAQRNLARLGALTIAAPGLVIATVTWSCAPRFRALPPERAACAAIGALPGVVQWAWPLATPDEDVERDLASLRAALSSAGARDVVVKTARDAAARVVSPPFAGEVGAVVQQSDAAGDRAAG